MRTALLLLSTLAITGCRPKLTLQRTLVQRDSVVVRFVPRDTTVWSARDSVRVTTSTDAPRTVTKRKGRATSTLQVGGGQVTATCVCDSAAIRLRLWDKWTRQTTSRKQVEQRTETVVRTPQWAWWSLALSIVLVLAALYRIAVRIARPWTLL
jgi:hypothetical protein